MTPREIQHLYGRAGFGANPNLLIDHQSLDRKRVVDSLFNKSKKHTPLKIDVSEFLNLTKEDLKNKQLKRELRKKSNEKVKEFNFRWLERLAHTEELLREKMTLFWANHFVVLDRNIIYVEQYNQMLREHALGNFREFVKAMSKQAAMIRYLNIKQNRKQTPNENFARELMELFTLGVGHYTENDIKESARAFTGYNHTYKGEFKLRVFQHDEGEKLFFGQTGNFDGDDIIDLILQNKQCARFICQKVYAYFVNDSIDEQRVEELTEVFYESYDIQALMQHLFMADWFYEEKNIGTKIKSPVEFLVGLQNVVPMTFQRPKDMLRIQKLLGQILLNPPNVAGWPGGKNWIDSNTIMLRLKLPSILLANAHISITPKGEFEDSFADFQRTNRKQFIKVEADWNTFETNFSSIKKEDLKHVLLVSKLSIGTSQYLESLQTSSKRDYVIQLMSLPEYQMC